MRFYAVCEFNKIHKENPLNRRIYGHLKGFF
jgi:hypothetical protein